MAICDEAAIAAMGRMETAMISTSTRASVRDFQFFIIVPPFDR